MFAGILAAGPWALTGCIAEMEAAQYSPCLGGLMLSLWLNSLATRIRAIPNDSCVLKSHTLPHREGQRSHQASPPPSLPPPPGEAGQFNTFFSSLALITTKYYSLVDISCSPPHQPVTGPHTDPALEKKTSFLPYSIFQREVACYSQRKNTYISRIQPPGSGSIHMLCILMSSP